MNMRTLCVIDGLQHKTCHGGKCQKSAKFRVWDEVTDTSTTVLEIADSCASGHALLRLARGSRLALAMATSIAQALHTYTRDTQE